MIDSVRKTDPIEIRVAVVENNVEFIKAELAAIKSITQISSSELRAHVADESLGERERNKAMSALITSNAVLNTTMTQVGQVLAGQEKILAELNNKHSTIDKKLNEIETVGQTAWKIGAMVTSVVTVLVSAIWVLLTHFHIV